MKMFKICEKCKKEKKLKISRGQVVNLANPSSKIPPSSDWWICQNCDYEEKA